MQDTITVREAEPGDRDAVVAFTEDTWSDRGGGDYIPHVFEEWAGSDDPDQLTLVAATADDVAGLVQVRLLSEWEAWGQGMRVNPAFRDRGVSVRLTRRCFEWARERGASVMRNMVFSWNVMGLGQSRATGYRPVAEFRWANPEPDPGAAPGDLERLEDPDAAYGFWTGSDARRRLSGLGLDTGESWAASELTRERLARAADDGRLLALGDGDGVAAVTYLAREYDREDDEGVERTNAVYGASAWRDSDAARDLLAAVAGHAAERGADRTRVLVPESGETVSDVAYARVPVSDEPDFVLQRDLTAAFPEP